MIDPVSKAERTEPPRTEQRPDGQMDPRPLDSASTAAQEMASSLDVAIVQSERIRKLNAYWQAKAKGKVPSRSDIDPVDVAFQLNVGVAVPRTVVLHPLPPRIIEIVPAYADYQFFILADGTIIIVDPGTFRVVYVLVA